MDEEDVGLLKMRLELAELKRELLEARRKTETMQAVIDQQCQVIKENTALLRKQRLPPRPPLNHTAKALIAQSQSWRCANPSQDCPLFKLGDGLFGRDLYEIDHIHMWSKSGQHTNNLRALCSFCHAVITRQQIAQTGVEEDSHTGDE